MYTLNNLHQTVNLKWDATLLEHKREKKTRRSYTKNVHSSKKVVCLISKPKQLPITHKGKRNGVNKSFIVNDLKIHETT